jgi:hypothetical protein
VRLDASQLLEFVEPETGVTVKLVGSMHYNPTSIELATNTIQALAEKNELGSVIIESCDIRYDSSKTMSPFLKTILRSEMGAACDVALAYNRPVVLGDQRINITVANMKSAFQETLWDALQPLGGGWNRIVANITQAWEDASPNEAPYLTPLSFLDPQLLLTAPVSFFKYPLSYLTKSPVATLAFLSCVAVLSNPSEALAQSSTPDLTWYDVAASLGVATIETVVFARVILKEVLHDRNVVLADSILRQCRLYQRQQNRSNNKATSSGTKSALSPWSAFFSPSKAFATTVDDDHVVYVKSSGTMTATTGGSPKTVVAVLGMAHCNGIKKILQERSE